MVNVVVVVVVVVNNGLFKDLMIKHTLSNLCSQIFTD